MGDVNVQISGKTPTPALFGLVSEEFRTNETGQTHLTAKVGLKLHRQALFAVLAFA